MLHRYKFLRFKGASLGCLRGAGSVAKGPLPPPTLIKNTSGCYSSPTTAKVERLYCTGCSLQFTGVIPYL